MMTQDFTAPIPTNWNKASVEHIASLVANHFSFAIGDPVEELVAALGGKIRYGWQSFDEIDGGSIIARSFDDFQISVSEHTSAKRDRFTIAHELGHLFLHLQKVKEADPNATMRATRHVNKNDAEQQRAEWEANWFAAQLLMPRDEFKKYVQTYGVEHAAIVFGVSEHAARVRSESI
jgi:predicted transcriptional regulator